METLRYCESIAVAMGIHHRQEHHIRFLALEVVRRRQLDRYAFVIKSCVIYMISWHCCRASARLFLALVERQNCYIKGFTFLFLLLSSPQSQNAFSSVIRACVSSLLLLPRNGFPECPTRHSGSHIADSLEFGRRSFCFHRPKRLWGKTAASRNAEISVHSMLIGHTYSAGFFRRIKP